MFDKIHFPIVAIKTEVTNDEMVSLIKKIKK